MPHFCIRCETVRVVDKGTLCPGCVEELRAAREAPPCAP